MWLYFSRHAICILIQCNFFFFWAGSSWITFYVVFEWHTGQQHCINVILIFTFFIIIILGIPLWSVTVHQSLVFSYLNMFYCECCIPPPNPLPTPSLTIGFGLQTIITYFPPNFLFLFILFVLTFLTPPLQLWQFNNIWHLSQQCHLEKKKSLNPMSKGVNISDFSNRFIMINC